jgi:type I restriction-modification system DNA methylase subunit
MSAPDIIHHLVAKFDDHLAAYRSGNYKEAHLRQEFLDPFFETLGWDMRNLVDLPPDARDVIFEDSLVINQIVKAPDYAFRIGQKNKFFVEAKRPSVNIAHGIDPSFQLKLYAWNAHLPLSILTDFEEFAIYDCRNLPHDSDQAATSRKYYFTYTDYLEKWDEIAALFSRQSVDAGSLDKYAAENKSAKGTIEVDDAFLNDIEEWRKKLAQNIALRNSRIADEHQLNYAVQMTLDRIIFLRICEDHGIEPEFQLKEIATSPQVYPALLSLFQKADRRYNSGLFHFTSEKDYSTPEDTFTPALKIDDAALKEVIKGLYYPCPYIFKVIPVEILGRVYEQFLGSVIHLTPSHQARVESKPEVRKAGGVYYTPSYIVDYIVKNTVGKLLEGKTPAEASSLKIVDPACGSGSFLLGAYQCLLVWHADYYISHDPAKWARQKKPALLPTSVGCWRLTTEEKKRILLNNIHGVDIDRQAVEVTKLSLLLKVLEEETGQLTLGFERALPDLGANIKCGNSLIGEDYFAGKLIIDKEERDRVNPFDWQTAFPQVFARGGFDAVIGNPPYRMVQPHNTEGEILDYFSKKYAIAKYKIEMFHMFLQLGVILLKQNGYHSFIVPATILNNVFAEKLRTWILDQCSIKKISVADEMVFENVDVHTLVLVLEKERNSTKRNQNKIEVTTHLNRTLLNENATNSYIEQSRFHELPGMVWNVLFNDDNSSLLLRLIKDYQKLEDVAKINRGLITGNRDKYFSREKLTKSHIPIITGADSGRYFLKEPSEYILFIKPKGSGGTWDPEVHLAKHKVLVRQIGTKPLASYLNEPYAVTGNLFTVRCENENEELFILGLINSRLLKYFWKVMFYDFKSTFPQVTIFSLSQLPISIIDYLDSFEISLHDRLIKLVKQMLDLYKRSPATPQEKDALQREIAATDRQIDQLVYQLYDLTEEEIRIVEG